MTINRTVNDWSATVLIIMAPPGMEAKYVLDDPGCPVLAGVCEQYPGSDAYVSMTGTAGSALTGRGSDSWNSQDDSAEGLWFSSTYIEVPEGTLLGFVHVSSIVSAAHLRDVITALNDSMFREEPGVATRFPEETCLKAGNPQGFVMWPDRVITKTVREKLYAHRNDPGCSPIGDFNEQ